jgi:hypothetical protein
MMTAPSLLSILRVPIDDHPGKSPLLAGDRFSGEMSITRGTQEVAGSLARPAAVEVSKYGGAARKP